MGLLLVLGWLGAVIILCLQAYSGVRDAPTDADGRVSPDLTAAFIIASAPPTLVCLVSLFVLVQAAPTVQFNAGSSWAMGLWSFWVDCWPIFVIFSWVQLAGYFCWLIGTFIIQTRSSVRHIVALALLASVLGTFLLSMAFPTA